MSKAYMVKLIKQYIKNEYRKLNTYRNNQI